MAGPLAACGGVLLARKPILFLQSQGWLLMLLAMLMCDQRDGRRRKLAALVSAVGMARALGLAQDVVFVVEIVFTSEAALALLPILSIRA